MTAKDLAKHYYLDACIRSHFFVSLNNRKMKAVTNGIPEMVWPKFEYSIKCTLFEFNNLKKSL